MANVKISQLTSASSLTGSEVLPVVQGGTTKKVTTQAIADLASGGGAESFSVTANGTLGYDIDVSYSQKSFVPKTGTGEYAAEIRNYASFNFYGTGGGYGGYGGYGGSSVTTTATNIAFNLRYAGDISINGGGTVQHISFPELIDQNSNMSGLQINGSSLVSISAPLLQSCRGINISGTSLTTLSFPSLVSFRNGGQIQIGSACALTQISATNFPALTEISLSIYEPGFLQVISLPSATVWKNTYHASVGGSTGSSVLNTLSYPNIVNYDSAYISYSYHTSLANVALGTPGVTKRLGSAMFGAANINFEGCALTEASIDGILTLLVSLDGTNGTELSSNGTVYLHGGTNAALSSTGAAAKDILLTRGFYIVHN